MLTKEEYEKEFRVTNDLRDFVYEMVHECDESTFVPVANCLIDSLLEAGANCVPDKITKVTQHGGQGFMVTIDGVASNGLGRRIEVRFMCEWRKHQDMKIELWEEELNEEGPSDWWIQQNIYVRINK